ncbi:YfhH family protein [Pueribacillus sp. YX66]|uniref:YfhH family protein n=1 Tax=Pueribacillus sp. YX66 TaxID=3229242 RepID=UPI00358D1402
MDKRFSEMTKTELQAEIGKLHEKAQKAEQLGIINEVYVLKRKIVMAEAYLLDPADFKKGETYNIKDEQDVTFTIDYLKGTFAWGYKEGSNEPTAYPISLLVKQ